MEPGQDSLFQGHPARTTDPETSHLAADRVREFADDHHDRICLVLKERVDGVRVVGLTVHEIAAYVRLTAHEIGKRVSEIEGKRIAIVYGADGKELKRKGPTGRGCRVWRPLSGV